MVPCRPHHVAWLAHLVALKLLPSCSMHHRHPLCMCALLFHLILHPLALVFWFALHIDSLSLPARNMKFPWNRLSPIPISKRRRSMEMAVGGGGRPKCKGLKREPLLRDHGRSKGEKDHLSSHLSISGHVCECESLGRAFLFPF